MTAVDPLSVACPLCMAAVGEKCLAPRMIDTGTIHLRMTVPTHAARETIAERAARPTTEEKTMTTGQQPDLGLRIDEIRVKANAQPVHDEILDTAKTIINGDRRDDYGSARESFGRIAQLWSVVLGKDITAHDVALCMVQLKVARALVSPEKRDSYVDMCGYAALGGHIAAEDHQNEENS